MGPWWRRQHLLCVSVWADADGRRDVGGLSCGEAERSLHVFPLSFVKAGRVHIFEQKNFKVFFL